MNFDKDSYSQFCSREKYIPIFSQPWWLDSVCGPDNWDVIIVRNDKDIIASFPYYHSKIRYSLKIITMPILTQKMGVYIKYPDNLTSSSKLIFEKKIYNEIIDKLPEFDYLDVNLDHKYLNWLPFYWRGFNQTTQYSYVIEDISNPEIVFENFGSNKKRDIRKITNQLTISFTMPPGIFINLYKSYLKRIDKELSYSEDLFLLLCTEASKRNQGEIICARDKDENIHAAIFYIWDHEYLYTLVNALDPDFRNSGASTYLFFQIMKRFSSSNLQFNFYGSMIENVEQSLNRFGSTQKIYFRIFKANSKKYRLIKGLKELKEITFN